MIYRIVFALLATKAAGFAAFHDHDHDDDAKMMGDHHDDHCPEPDPWARMVGAMPPEFTPGIQSGTNFYAGVTIARIRPYMHDRLEKCIMSSHTYEPVDFNPCTADLTEECSCFNIIRLFRTHPNATGVVYSTPFINDEFIIAMAVYASEQDWRNFNEAPIAGSPSLREQVFRSITPFLDFTWPEGAAEPFRTFGGPVAFPIWGATGAQSPICASPGSHGCPHFGRVSLLPIDNEMDFGHFMQIMPSASDALVAQPGLLWTVGIRDAEEGMVVVMSAYDSHENRANPQDSEHMLGQAWGATVAPMFPYFNCPCAEGFAPNICANPPGSPDNAPGCRPPGTGCLGGEPHPDDATVFHPPCITSMEGESEWSFNGRDPNTGAAINKGIDPLNEPWVNSAFNQFILCGGCAECFGEDGTPIDPAPEACAVCATSTCTTPLDAGGQVSRWGDIPCDPGYALPPGVFEALGGSCDSQAAIDCAEGCSVCLDCGSNAALDPTFVCPPHCANPDLSLVPDGMKPCNAACVPYIGCFNCHDDHTA